jgi:hypothetical protein
LQKTLNISLYCSISKIKEAGKLPRSHKHGLMVSMTPKRGLHVYFQKKASGFNECIGKAIRGKKFPSRQAVRDAFTSAVAGCAGRKKAKKE